MEKMHNTRTAWSFFKLFNNASSLTMKIFTLLFISYISSTLLYSLFSNYYVSLSYFQHNLQQQKHQKCYFKT